MSRVFQECSRLQIPSSEVESIDEQGGDILELPDGIERIDFEEVNGRLQITSVASDDSLSKYTPTAKLKGGYEERIVVQDEEDGCTHKSVKDYRSGGWKQYDEDELETKTVEYLNVQGHGDSFLVHKQLRRQMFELACQLSEIATKGFIQGVIVEDGEINPVRYEAGGEQTEVELNIDVVDQSQKQTDSESDDEGAQWAQF